MMFRNFSLSLGLQEDIFKAPFPNNGTLAFFVCPSISLLYFYEPLQVRQLEFPHTTCKIPKFYQ